jgi:AcrR family transcriptional regulator
MTAIATGAVRTGRPRSTRAHEAIIDAIIEMMSEGITVDALSIEAVAARAGVGKATIYRRWSSKQEMLTETMRVLKGPPPEPKGRNTRERLLSLVNKMAVGDERAAKVFPCMLPEIMRSDEAYDLWQTFVEERREVMRGVLRRGIAEGELRADLDNVVATSALSGPILMNRIMRWNPHVDNAKLPEQIVDLVLGGISLPAAPTS